MVLPLVSTSFYTLHTQLLHSAIVLLFYLTGNEDYISTDKNLTFAFGFGTIQCVHIPIINDECLEEDMEFFNVSISSDMDGVVIGVDEVTVYIIDDDSKQ